LRGEFSRRLAPRRTPIILSFRRNATRAREDADPVLVFFCPDCAEREFGPLLGVPRRASDDRL
jgi:hypothetical protein